MSLECEISHGKYVEVIYVIDREAWSLGYGRRVLQLGALSHAQEVLEQSQTRWPTRLWMKLHAEHVTTLDRRNESASIGRRREDFVVLGTYNVEGVQKVEHFAGPNAVEER